MTQSYVLNANFDWLQAGKKEVFPGYKIDNQKTVFDRIAKAKRSTFDRSKFKTSSNWSGTITDDGIASGFSGSSFIDVENIDLTNAKTLKINYRAKFDNLDTVQVITAYGNTSAFWSGIGTGRNFYAGVQIFKIENVGIYDIELNFNITSKTVFCRYKAPNQSSFVVTDEKQLSDATLAPLATIKPYHIGCQVTAFPFLNEIYLSYFSITVDGVEVFNGNKTGVDQIKKDDYTKVGSPIITEDGIASGGHIQKNVSVDNIDSFRQTLSIRYKSAGEGVNQQILYLYGASTSTNTTQIEYILTDTSFSITRRYNGVWGRPVVLTTNFIDGDLIDVDAEFTQTEIKYSIYKNGILIANDIKAVASSPFKIETIALTASYSYIDLNSYKFYLNNNLVYQPTLRIPYTQSKTDEKIVDAVYRDRVQDMYEQFGYTHYYTLGDDDYTLATVPNEKIVAEGETSGIAYERRADLTLTQRGNCTNGSVVNLLPYKDSNSYSVTAPYSAKTANSFTPTVTGDFIATGKAVL